MIVWNTHLIFCSVYMGDKLTDRLIGYTIDRAHHAVLSEFTMHLARCLHAVDSYATGM